MKTYVKKDINKNKSQIISNNFKKIYTHCSDI